MGWCSGGGRLGLSAPAVPADAVAPLAAGALPGPSELESAGLGDPTARCVRLLDDADQLGQAQVAGRPAHDLPRRLAGVALTPELSAVTVPELDLAGQDAIVASHGEQPACTKLGPIGGPLPSVDPSRGRPSTPRTGWRPVGRSPTMGPSRPRPRRRRPGPPIAPTASRHRRARQVARSVAGSEAASALALPHASYRPSVLVLQDGRRNDRSTAGLADAGLRAWTGVSAAVTGRSGAADHLRGGFGWSVAAPQHHPLRNGLRAPEGWCPSSGCRSPYGTRPAQQRWPCPYTLPLRSTTRVLASGAGWATCSSPTSA